MSDGVVIFLIAFFAGFCIGCLLAFVAVELLDL